ncbi:MAG: hypothetical protein M0P91_00715 [Sulfuricurvum sp.]|jgi:flagellin|uniref:flagellin n=1 Tax=Sulfuricurvum sp. TaxID=2025608 RepID=UPI0025D15452|nr:flagellin [Sulfuricurvum sp.]MCK9371691.1 hypothetical protein [Sulfuricurvum sp.]
MQLNTQYSALPHMNAEVSKQDKTLEKIAAAQQLNREDAAARSIAQMLQNEIGGDTQGLMNANDGIAMMQIADGTLENLSRQTEVLSDLSVRNNSASLNASQKEMLQGEFNRTIESMQQSINNTSFNEQSLFDNSFTFSMGGETLSASLGNVTPQSLSIENPDSIAAYAQNLSTIRSDTGSAMKGFISTSDSLLTKIAAESAAKSQIADTDMAKAIREFQQSNNQITASQIAMSHQTQTLRQSIGELLG